MTALAALPRHGYLPVVPPAPEPDPDPEPDPEPPTIPAPAAWVDHPGTDRTINQILVTGGRLILAHGSWWGGDHRIVWADLDGTPHTGPLVPSEGFQVVREYGGTIFLPWQDPTGAWNAPQGYSYSTDGTTWRDKRVGPAAHFFDLREHDGTLYLAGSGVGFAAIWESHDNGTTWAESLVVEADGMPRFLHALAAAGSLWCRVSTFGGTSYQLTGGAWEATEVPVPIHDGYGFGLSAGGVAYGIRSAFDGARTVGYPQHRPCWADATHVYAINPATTYIDRAPLLTPEDTEVTWTPWLDMGEGMTGHVATTATLHDGWVYVGGTQGRIWRYSAPTA